MKKIFIFIMVMLMTVVTSVSAQTNYAGSAKFTDNTWMTLQGGIVTPSTSDFFKNGSVTPTVVLGFGKDINPWLGIEIEGRTSIGTGDNYNYHTAFDMVNVSGYARFNVLNLVNNLNGVRYDGTRKFFEPVVYTGLGWGHINCSDVASISDNYDAGENGVPTEMYGTFNVRNYMTYRAGVDWMFNLGTAKAWAIDVNTGFVWGNIDNGRLDKRNGNFEASVGVTYRFKTSNGTRTFNTYDIAALNKQINDLRAENDALKSRPAVSRVVEKIVTRVDTVETVKTTPESTFAVTFKQGSAELSDAAKAILDQIPAGKTVDITGCTSPEGSVRTNTKLAAARANAAADYLKSRGVTVKEVGKADAGRAAVVTIK